MEFYTLSQAVPPNPMDLLLLLQAVVSSNKRLVSPELVLSQRSWLKLLPEHRKSPWESTRSWMRKAGVEGTRLLLYLSNVLSFIEQRIVQNISSASEAKKITDSDWSWRIMIPAGHTELDQKKNISF